MGAVRQHLSAAYLLREVLADSQTYPILARQGAALGIYHLLGSTKLGDECRSLLTQLLGACVNGEKNRDFRERHAYLLFGSGRTEMVKAIRDGLEWMVLLGDHAAGANRPSTEPLSRTPAGGDATRSSGASLPAVAWGGAIADYTHLHQIVGLLWEKLPGAIAFFRDYPLRLMCLDGHTSLLGQYVENGCGLELWTRYQPPKNVGQVERRYLRLDNRTTPNSMGIYYRLFLHPLLAVPVLYHEYLHYAGLGDDPAGGIKNEMEVRFREHLFTRSLLAEQSPPRDEELPAYETALADAVTAAGMQSVLRDVLCNYSDEELRMCNENAESLYGSRLARSEAALEALLKLLEKPEESSASSDPGTQVASERRTAIEEILKHAKKGDEQGGTTGEAGDPLRPNSRSSIPGPRPPDS